MIDQRGRTSASPSRPINMTVRADLTRQEQFLVDWLSKADDSAVGECKGVALAHLIELGLVHVVRQAADHDYSRVALTDAGWKLVDDRPA